MPRPSSNLPFRRSTRYDQLADAGHDPIKHQKGDSLGARGLFVTVTVGITRSCSSPPTTRASYKASIHTFFLFFFTIIPPIFLPDLSLSRTFSFAELALMGSVVDVAIEEGSLTEKKPTVVFVLGGPGSGKGTQCANIVQHFGFTHLSAGDLLRAEIKSGSENGTMIQNRIRRKDCAIRSDKSSSCRKQCRKSGNDSSLLMVSLEMRKIVPHLKLLIRVVFDCSEEEMERRLLNRNQGREDDNIETIRKRFKVFLILVLPVIQHYNSRGKVRKIDAGKPVEEVLRLLK
ncbi:adenylate kinase [Psidium guajava]|nr:adenylate kinase [Psidium guajava]